MTQIYHYKNTDVFAQDAAAAIEDFIQWTLQEKETVKIAVSGGKSPVAVYRQLIKNNSIEWDKVELFMTDERYVSAHSEDSNARLLETELISKTPLLKFFHSFDTSLPVEEAARQYDEMLETQGKKLFDLVILGMGEDGHTASLFPGGPELKERVKWATTSQSPDGMRRLTLTMPAILSSEKIFFLIQGKQKRSMIDALLDKKKPMNAEFPAKMVLQHPHVEIYYNEHA